MTITLYFAPFTRATRPRWLLEELGVPYTLEVVDTKAGAHKSPAYLANVHPLGKVPALRVAENGVEHVIVESGAIVAWLADRFVDKGFAPRLDDPLRGPYLQWLFYAYATLEPALVAVASHHPQSPQHTPSTPEQQTKDTQKLKDVLAVVEAAVGKREYLLPSGFSAADVVTGAIVQWAASLKQVDREGPLGRYADRCKAREAWKRSR